MAQNPKVLPRFPELDGLRGIAVLLVFLHHATLFLTSGPHDRLQTALQALFAPAKAGVDLFFVLSGFLITSILLRERRSTAYYHDFYWKRVLRVLPVYLVVLAGILVFIPHSLAYVAFSALFLANFASVFHVQLTTPFWSLAVEEQFYLLWPMVVRRRSTAGVAKIAILVAASSMVLRLFLATRGHYNYYLTFLHCDGLALGALLSCRFEYLEGAGRNMAGDSARLRAALGFGLCVFASSFLLSPSGRMAPYAADLELTGLTILSFAAVGLCIAGTQSRALAILRSPLLTFFGLISYAFYLTHVFLFESYDKLIVTPKTGSDLAFFLRIAVVLLMSVGVSLVSRFVIELPALSLRRRVLSRPAPQAETEKPLTQTDSAWVSSVSSNG